MLRWLWDNLGTLLLAVVLSFSVWVIAVNTEDPLQERLLPASVPIQYRGLPAGLTILGEPPGSGRVTVRAPESVWKVITADDVHLVIDLGGLKEGTYQIPVQVQLSRRPARVLLVDPGAIRITLEPSASVTLPVQVEQQGQPAVGQRVQSVVVAPSTAVISGPSSQVALVRAVRATVSLETRTESLQEVVPLRAMDEAGAEVPGVVIAPRQARVIVNLEQLGGYRSVAVIPLIRGQVLPGFRVTNITVTPTLVTAVSADPQAIDLLPGYIETEPISISGASADIQQRVSLNLPQGFSVVGENTVLVEVTIAPIESSITIVRRLEILGLAPGLAAQVSPETVSVILTGPLLTLERLLPEQARLVVDLAGLGPGTHQVAPSVVDLPENVVTETVLPDLIEVTIRTAGVPTPTPAP